MNIEFQTLPKNTDISLDYQFYTTKIGKLLLVSWQKSLVYSAFASEQNQALTEAKNMFPYATFTKKESTVQKQVVQYLANPQKFTKTLSVALAGSPFQIQVWKTLAKVPFGSTVFYSELAKAIKQPGAVRAVASAVAKNPLAILIPCHRVLPKSGGIGKYHWGPKNKSALLAWERLPGQK